MGLTVRELWGFVNRLIRKVSLQYVVCKRESGGQRRWKMNIYY